MNNLLTTSNITFAIGILAVIFSVFQYFRKPQEASDKRDALLTQQLKFMTDANEARFKTMQENFTQLLLQSNNHIHTVDTKVEVIAKTVADLDRSITRLSTIIDERIPKK